MPQTIASDKLVYPKKKKKNNRGLEFTVEHLLELWFAVNSLLPTTTPSPFKYTRSKNKSTYNY